MRNVVKKHESYGKLQVSRVSGGARTLFGSSIQHRDTVRLSVFRAEHERSSNMDWYFDRGLPLVEVEMSQTQFAEAITSMNMGSGVPVTIKYTEGRDMEECPHTSKIEEFNDEFTNQMEEIARRMEATIKRTREVLRQKKTINKSEKEEILHGLSMLIQEVGSNIPFINEQFTEQMEKTVLESKGEVEGFILNKVQTLGLKELKNRVPELEQINKKEE